MLKVNPDQIINDLIGGILLFILITIYNFLSKKYNKRKMLKIQQERKEKRERAKQEALKVSKSTLSSTDKSSEVNMDSDINAKRKERGVSSIIQRTIQDMESILFEPITRFIVFISSVISMLIIFQGFYESIFSPRFGFVPFLSEADKQFAINFIEWFGVLYGVLIPLILITVLRQFNELDHILEKETNAIKAIFVHLSVLDSQSEKIKKALLSLLSQYIQNAIDFMDGNLQYELEKQNGDEIINNIRTNCLNLMYNRPNKSTDKTNLFLELIHQVDSVASNRIDRNSLTGQRISTSLQSIAVLISTIWLVPFYFLYFQDNNGLPIPPGIFGWLLIIFVTFTVIVILAIIDDLDKPFDGYWKVSTSTWENLSISFGNELTKLETNKVKAVHRRREKTSH